MSVTALVVVVLAPPVVARGAAVALTDCCERVEPPEEGVEPLLDDGVVVPLELELDDAPLEPVPEPEPDDETAAGQPRRWSAASCFFAAASVALSAARVCSADVSCSLAELRLDSFCAIWAGVPPAFAVASAARSFCSVAFADASVSAASVGLILASTWFFATGLPTVACSAVSVPLVANVGEADSADEMLPEADTLDCTSPSDTVTVRATPLDADDDVS